jgi:hypothetical protein
MSSLTLEQRMARASQHANFVLVVNYTTGSGKKSVQVYGLIGNETDARNVASRTVRTFPHKVTSHEFIVTCHD